MQLLMHAIWQSMSSEEKNSTMKELWIGFYRYSYTAKSSIGRIYFEYDDKKEYFGYSLEDAARAWNVKVYGETCLPGGLKCDVSLFENEKFGKTIIFHTAEDKMTIIYGPLSWVGCVAHGGNTAEDTSGCPLVAKTYINPDYVYGSLKDELRTFIEQKINEGYTIKAKFVNLTQMQTR